MVKKILVTLVVCVWITLNSSQECGFSEEAIVPPRLTVINKTSWPASVYWRAQNREYNTIINAHSREIWEMLLKLLRSKSRHMGKYGVPYFRNTQFL